MTQKVVSLNIKAGIQRDGTQFDAPCFTDGQWVRFQRGRPRKIGGFDAIFPNATSISRGMTMSSFNGLNYVVSGTKSGLESWVTDNNNGEGAGPDAFTLAGFTANDNYVWQFDIAADSSGGGGAKLIAHPGQNLVNIDSTVNTPVFSGAFPGLSLSRVGLFTQTATTVSGSPTVTLSASNIRIGPGQLVTGANIAPGTTVVAVSGTSLTISQNATGSGSTTLTFDNQVNVSGGCVILHPYLFVYGNDGLIRNSSAGDFSNWVSPDANANNVATGKIVKGLPLRGGNASPAGLFWALDSLIRVSFSPTQAGSSTLFWRYDIISSQTSILSSSSVIEYDGLYFWCGVDRFLMYTGVVQEIPNQFNINYFFDGLNYSQRQKVWAAKVPRWGEIWWFYPRGAATECNDAIIYNVRDQVWYDAGLAEGANRSAGTFSEVFPKPLWADNRLNNQNKYAIWQHEQGTDMVYLNMQTAVKSFFETNNIGWVTGGPGVQEPVGLNRFVRLERVEPDFVQSGSMSLYVYGKGYADDVDVVTGPFDFSPETLKLDLREQRREMRLRFESNTQNGNYETGNVLLSVDIGDERSTG